MGWISKFFTSSLGRKIIMSLTGLFLIVFLVIHLVGNTMLIFDHDPSHGNFAAFVEFMEHNPLIKIMAWGLYAGFIIHIVQGLLLYFKNRYAKGQKYAVRSKVKVSWMSKNMPLLGTIILVFLIGHLGHFFVPLKVTHTMAEHSLGQAVIDLYHNAIFVAFYIVGLIALSLHLMHGFQSAFQTLGLNHVKYSPIIKGLGMAYSILIPLGFAIIPLYFFLFK